MGKTAKQDTDTGQPTALARPARLLRIERGWWSELAPWERLAIVLGVTAGGILLAAGVVRLAMSVLDRLQRVFVDHGAATIEIVGETIEVRAAPPRPAQKLSDRLAAAIEALPKRLAIAPTHDHD